MNQKPSFSFGGSGGFGGFGMPATTTASSTLTTGNNASTPAFSLGGSGVGASFNFGGATTSASSPFSLSTNTNQTSSSGFGGFGGATAPKTTALTSTFGATTAPAFGVTPVPAFGATPAPSNSFSFSSSSNLPSTGFNFAVSTPAPAAAQTTAPATTTGFGGFSGLGSSTPLVSNLGATNKQTFGSTTTLGGISSSTTFGGGGGLSSTSTGLGGGSTLGGSFSGFGASAATTTAAASSATATTNATTTFGFGGGLGGGLGGTTLSTPASTLGSLDSKPVTNLSAKFSFNAPITSTPAPASSLTSSISGAPLSQNFAPLGGSLGSTNVLGSNLGSTTVGATTTSTTDTKPGLKFTLPSTATPTATASSTLTGTTANSALNPSLTTASTSTTGLSGLGGSTISTLSTLPSFTMPANTTVNSATTTSTTTSAPLKIEPGQSKGLGGVTSLSSTNGNNDTTTKPGVTKSTLPKDQNIPVELNTSVEEFKKHLIEIRKTKELNSIYSNKPLLKNIEELNVLKQNLGNSNSELQKAIHEAAKLKNVTSQELRHVDICEQLKDIPLGMQYENAIWNEYFTNHIQRYEQQLKAFKNQFQQLDDYFKAHDSNYNYDPQKIVEVVKILHRNILNSASNLKIAHESVQTLKDNYTKLRRYTYGHTDDIFEQTDIKHESIYLDSSSIGPNPFSNN